MCINPIALRTVLAVLSAVGFSKHMRDNQNLLAWAVACLIQVYFSAFTCFGAEYTLINPIALRTAKTL